MKLAPLAAGPLRRMGGGLKLAWGLVPLTWSGWIVLILALAGLWWRAIPDMDLLLLMGAACIVVLTGLLVVLTGLVGVWTWRASRIQPELTNRLQTETPQLTGYELAVPTWLPLITLGWSWDRGARCRIAPERGRWREYVTATRRGIRDRVTRHFEIGDSLGLTRLRLQRTQVTPVQILPDPGKLYQIPLLIRMASGEDISDPRGDPTGDRVDMRQYTRGDSPRTILWKIYARTRRLMVRVPERALTARPRLCAYLVTGPDDEPAAGLARVILEKGMLGAGWRFGTEGQDGYDQELVGALHRLARSGDTPDEERSGLDHFLRQAARDGYAGCVVLMGLSLGRRRAAVAQALARSPLSITSCLGVDGLQAVPPRRSWWQRQFLAQPAPDAQLERLESLLQALGRGLGEPILVDRSAGVVVGDVRTLLLRHRKGTS